MRVSGDSPFAAGCNGAPQTGTVSRNAEVELWVSVNPETGATSSPSGSRTAGPTAAPRGTSQASPFDRGGLLGAADSAAVLTLRRRQRRKRRRLRAGDRPVGELGRDGTAHQIALTINDSNAISADPGVGGRRDGGAPGAGSRRSSATPRPSCTTTRSRSRPIPTDRRFVYAVWDRLQQQDPADPASPFSGDTLFARSTDGGRTWEPTQDDIAGTSSWFGCYLESVAVRSAARPASVTRLRKAWVRSSRGDPKSRSGGPCSRITPS